MIFWWLRRTRAVRMRLIRLQHRRRRRRIGSLWQWSERLSNAPVTSCGGELWLFDPLSRRRSGRGRLADPPLVARTIILIHTRCSGRHRACTTWKERVGGRGVCRRIGGSVRRRVAQWTGSARRASSALRLAGSLMVRHGVNCDFSSSSNAR